METKKISLKDRSYSEKQKAVREAYNRNNKDMNQIVNMNMVNIYNIIEANKIMKEARFSDDDVIDAFKQVSIDGYIAYEKIRSKDDEILGLVQLDVTTLQPSHNGDWVQHIESDNFRTIKPSDLLYVSMAENFDKLIDVIEK